MTAMTYTTNPRRAWHDGVAAGRAEVAVILLDLIAELRDLSGNRALRLDLADWAEERLREVTDG